MVSATALTKELQKLLKAADLEVTTERKLTQALVDKFGTAALTHQELISAQIQDFLQQDGGVDDADDENSDEDDFEDNKKVAGNRKRKGTASAGPGKPAKAAKAVSNSNEFALELADNRRLTVGRFGSNLLVGIREFYEKDGELCPGKKGISLSLDQWAKLRGSAADVSKAADDCDLEYALDLASMRRVTITEFKGRVLIDLREFYEKEGQQLPGKKGIALSQDQWALVCGSLDAVDEAIKQQNGGTAPQPKQTAQPATGVFGGPSTSAAGGAPEAPHDQAADPSAGSPSNAGNPAELPVQLSAMRRADVSEFKGTKYVNIREYYEKDGKLLPGSKGISLPEAQFQALRDSAGELSEHLNAGSELEVTLSGKRKASVSSFKGKFMINIREYYEKDGKQLPGKKGISLPREQWIKLTQHLDALAAALTA
ncbi:hypothetical protein WJX72_006917 [[Myrmecia] bisecta]|uniref:DEK-C domain-containing protein n=1 Tax=[Myrmecia] bisecta TaxID=41462 RepID=A0AAW1Q7F6_9CHLO